MTRTAGIAAALAVALVIGGCKSPEEKLIDRRTELRDDLDELYGAYSGREGAGEGDGRDEGLVGRLFAGVERAQFDEYCLAIGRGERPFALSGRLESFLKARDHLRACRRAAELQVEIEKLEASVASARRGSAERDAR